MDRALPHPYFAPFEKWIASLHASGDIRQESSEAVYRDMWGAFVAWCIGQNPPATLDHLTASQIEQFLAARAQQNTDQLGLSPRHAFRLVRLIDRVLQFDALVKDKSVNPAASECLVSMPEVRLANLESADPVPEWLSEPDVTKLIAYLTSVGNCPIRQSAGDAWISFRNCASVALQLGAGLTPADVRALTLQAPVTSTLRVVPRVGVLVDHKETSDRAGRPSKISVPKCGVSPARVAPMAPWASELLQKWLEVRMTNQVQGTYLFPSTKSGKPWGKVAQYNAANAVLNEAGISGGGGGSFRLRHTFAIRQIQRGTDVVKVAQWLGIEQSAMTKYLRVLEWKEVVV
jgi:site-specific recombinase XerD